MKKRFLVLILLLLIVAALPVAASAETESGTCGDNLTWTLTDSGVLTISGTGKMNDYDYYTAPWGRTVKQVKIEQGVTSIGRDAFSGCSSLTSVTIPNSVTSIGGFAFYDCSSLTSVTIPDSVTSIGSSAFYGCSSLTSVTIPTSVTSIGYRAFYECSSLTSVTIPDGVTSIGSSAFYGCPAIRYTTKGSDASVALSKAGYSFREPGKNYSIRYLFTNNTQTGLELSTVDKAVTSLTIPNDVTSIGDGAFSVCSSLTSVTIPNSVTSIGSYAFQYCSSLTSVTIPNSVTSIGGYAFYECSSLTNVTIPDGIEGIGDSAFYYNTIIYASKGSDASIALSKAGCTFREKGKNYSLKYLFANNTQIGLELSRVDKDVTSFTIPKDVTSIGENAFYECSSLTSVTIPNSVTSIGYDAFSGCSNLIGVVLPDSITSIGYDAFSSTTAFCKAGTATENACINAGVSYVLPSGSCGDHLTYTLTTGGLLTISGTGQMDNYETNWNNSNNSPWKNYPKQVAINNGVTGIGSSAFSGCRRLTSVTIPNSVTSIREGAFDGCKGLTSVTIPNSVTSLGAGAFHACRSLTSVILPNSITTIGYSAFEYCSNLKSITIPNSITAINNWTFQYCTSLTSVIIPNNITSIGQNAFCDCSSLTSVTIEEGERHNSWGGTTYLSIYSSAFANCKNLTSITIPNCVGTIGENAFSNCSKLKTVTIGNNCSIGSQAFSGCGNLTTATIGKNATGGSNSIGEYAFSECPKLANLTIGRSISSIGTAAFSNCSALTSVTIPDSVTTIMGNTFYNCTCLMNVTIPESVTEIGYYAFEGCPGSLTVYCYEGSKTQDYAQENGIHVVLLQKDASTAPTIEKQPTNLTVVEGETATFKVTADGASSYQWYYRTSETGTWKIVTNNGSFANYSLAASAQNNGYQFRCKAINEVGSVTTNVVTLTVRLKPTINKQPANQTVSAGETATFSVTAQNATAYQWYYRKSESDAWNRVVNNGASDTYSLATAAYNNGYQFRCMVKNSATSVYTNTVTLKVKPGITSQPSDLTVSAGETATFKVTATGATSYQWYYRKSASDAWVSVKTNGTSATYNLVTAVAHNGYQFRCLLKNDAGSVYTNTVTLKVKPGITTQPTDKTVSAGETATFKVTATGATSYQWYYRKSASDAWNRVVNNGASATYNLTTIAGNNGYQFRCLVKNDAGSVYTNIVTLKVKPGITTQPTDKTVNAGETATFKVTATGAASYQWYYRKSASDAWNRVVNNGASNTYNLVTIASHNNYQFRCLVKNDDGGVYSNTVTLTVTNKPTITAQPTDKTVNAGETASFKVTASKVTSY